MRVIFFFLFISLSYLLNGQVADSITVVDSIALKKQLRKEAKGEIIPKRALLLSIIPGGGQVYNRRWWKVPIVYGTFAGMIAAVEDNSRNYQRFKEAYTLKLADEIHEFSGTSLDSESSLRSLRDSFDKNRQAAYVGMFVVYVLQGVEAFVDAHLRDFDIDEDLSLQLKPKILMPPANVIGTGPLPVLSISITF